MNQKNIIALCLGIIVAGLLWEYYLKPKYDIKMGKEEVEYALRRADIDALDDATSKVEGELLYKSSTDPITQEGQESASMIDEEGASVKDDVLSKRSKEDKDFDFSSTANKPRTIFDIASSKDPKDTEIQVAAAEGVVMHPTIIPGELKAQQPEQEDRITMVLVPASYKLIKTDKALAQYKKENRGKYPKVDFSKYMLLVLESDSGLSSNFFEIVKVSSPNGEIAVDYRVNVLGASNKNNDKAYKIIKKSDKKVVLNQVK